MTAPAIGVFLPTMSERGEPTGRRGRRRPPRRGPRLRVGVGRRPARRRHRRALRRQHGGARRGGRRHRSVVRLAYGVMILPLRPGRVGGQAGRVAAAGLSGGRVLLGRRASAATATTGRGRPPACPGAERGRRTDAALAVLPDLIAGKAGRRRRGRPCSWRPACAVPPIVVGGMADAALARAVAHGDGWFTLPLPPAAAGPPCRAAGRPLAAEAGDRAPTITASASVAIDGDPSLPDPDALVRRLSDPDGIYGMPAEAVADLLVTGGPAAVAERLGGAGRPRGRAGRGHPGRRRLVPPGRAARPRRCADDQAAVPTSRAKPRQRHRHSTSTEAGRAHPRQLVVHRRQPVLGIVGGAADGGEERGVVGRRGRRHHLEVGEQAARGQDGRRSR